MIRTRHGVRLRLLARAAAAALALAAAPGARAQDTAGYVASVNGTWFTSARPAQPVSAGRVVRQGEEVWAAPRSSAGAYLNVVLRDGSRLALTCSVPGDCDRRHTLRLRAGFLQSAARMVDAVLGLVRREPEGFVSLISRADGPQPEDRVILQAGPQVDVSAALQELGAGQYRVSLTPWGRGIEAQQAHGYFGPDNRFGQAAAWSPGEPLIIPDVQPGLYVLRAASSAEDVRESWVLIAAAGPQTRAMQAEFEEARRMVSTWTGIDAPHDGRVFLRAYLASLAGLAPPPEPR
jgi:hypothetical protein